LLVSTNFEKGEALGVNLKHSDLPLWAVFLIEASHFLLLLLNIPFYSVLKTKFINTNENKSIAIINQITQRVYSTPNKRILRGECHKMMSFSTVRFLTIHK
jgi:type IV secretory pathway VirB3-like protein